MLNRVPFWALLASLFFVGGLIGVGLQTHSLYIQACEVASGAQEQCPSENIASFFLRKLAEFLDLHNGVVTAVATLAIAWFTLSLRDVSATQVKLTRDSFEILERADLSIYPSNFTLENIIQQFAVTTTQRLSRPSAVLQFNNTGRTAADIITVRTAMILAAAMPDEPPFMGTPDINVIERTIAAGQLGDGITMWLDRIPTPGDIDLLRGGGAFVFFYGAVNYESLGKDRMTVWCMRSERDGSMRYWGGRAHNYRA